MQKNNFNFNNQDFIKINNQLMTEFRTQPLIKLIVQIICGILPFIIAIMVFGANDVDFKQWSGISRPLEVQYGIIWLIGFAFLLFSNIIVQIIIKFSNEVKMDVISGTNGWAFAMFSLFVIPSPAWSFIFIFPIFGIFGLIFGQVIIIISSISKFKNLFQNIENNIDQSINNQSKENDDNPFVDVNFKEKNENKD